MRSLVNVPIGRIVFFSFTISDGWIMRVLHLFYTFILMLISISAQAEGTMVATVLQADFSRDPEVRLLVRVADVGGGDVSVPMASRSECLKRVESPERPGPDPCFSVAITEDQQPRNILQQTLLNDPHLSTDPIYLEIVYRSEVSESDPTNHHRRSALLRIEENGFYNWNDEAEQALADVELQAYSHDLVNVAFVDADARLNAAYRYRMAGLDQAKQEGLREAQRVWIKFRDAECKSDRKSDRSVSGDSTEQCLIRVTGERARQLSIFPEADKN